MRHFHKRALLQEQNISCSMTHLDIKFTFRHLGITHDQTIIRGQLFAGNMLASQLMKRKEKMR